LEEIAREVVNQMAKKKNPNALNLEQSAASTYNYSRTEIKFKPFIDDMQIREETPF
jgi:hypothetical protein